MSRNKIVIPKRVLEDLYLKKRVPLGFIMEQFKCSKRVVFDRLHEYGIPIRHDRNRNDITEKSLRDLYLTEKVSISKIAEKFKCSKGTIWQKFKEYNILVRSKSQAHIGKYKIEILEDIKSLYVDRKLSVEQLAKRFHCSGNTILKRLRYYGVAIRVERINIPKEDVETLYLRDEKTIYQIADMFECDSVTILNRLNQYGIPIRKKGESNIGKYKVEIPVAEIKKLYIENKIPISEIKKIFRCHADTLRKRLQRDGVSIRSIGEALRGNPSPMKGKHHTEETKKKLSILTVKQLASGSMKRKDTSIERKIEEQLRVNSIYFQKNISLCGVTVPDFYLPSHKLAIYADGDYWHNLPGVKIRDERQAKILQDNGYQILRFWEHEINESLLDCIHKIKNFIKI